MKLKTLKFSAAAAFSIPLLMWLAWMLSPNKKMVIAIVDKTVLDKESQEHVSLNWILNYQKYSKNHTERYSLSRDYYGFFPKEKEKFSVRGLERFSASQIEQLSEDADVAYFTDTYGIYKQEWYQQKENQKSSGMLYGGLSKRDLEFLKSMKARHKLVITEFNTIGSPTNEENRNQFELLFGMKWTGWTARYFSSLDTLVNKELPVWMIKNYTAKNGNQWTFKKAGIVFVNDLNQIVILEESTSLKDAMPLIVSSERGQEYLDLPEMIKYPFWFDIILPDLQQNDVMANFNLNLTERGKAELKKYGIPFSFPAVIQQKSPQPAFYYFSGDFCDNPISLTSSYFKGISLFKFFLYNTEDPMERKSFFWNFYRPMLTNILKHQETILKKY